VIVSSSIARAASVDKSPNSRTAAAVSRSTVFAGSPTSGIRTPTRPQACSSTSSSR